MELCYERGVLCKKLLDELKEYKKEKISHSSEDVFKDAYEIDAMVRIYELLVDLAETMEISLLRKLIQLPELLKDFYQVWMTTEDSSTQELKSCICHYLSQIQQISNIEYQKERWEQNEKIGIV